VCEARSNGRKIDATLGLGTGKPRIFLVVEALFPGNQPLVDLSRRGVNAPFTQLLEQQRLSDLAKVMLIHDVSDQHRTKMALFERGG
jgi:hypothetical protein